MGLLPTFRCLAPPSLLDERSVLACKRGAELPQVGLRCWKPPFSGFEAAGFRWRAFAELACAVSAAESNYGNSDPIVGLACRDPRLTQIATGLHT
jgi:hypothetical protein